MFKSKRILLLVLLSLIFSGVSQAENKTKNLESQFLLEMFRHPVKPVKNTKLKSFYPRLSIAAGQIEKFLYSFSEQEGSTLGFLLTHSGKPSVTANNPYVSNTKNGKTSSYEALIYKRIMASREKLLPHQVLGIALEVTGGDYPVATLTCHNFLKEITYSYRNKDGAVIGWDPNNPAAAKEWNVISDRDVIAVMDKLTNLRSSTDRYAKDTGGPWYHMFGLYFIGGLTSGGEAEMFASAENLYRRIGWGTNATDDSFKMGINIRAGNLCYWLNYLTENAIYIPEDLSLVTDRKLKENLTSLKALHRKLLDQLKVWGKFVNNPKFGFRAEMNMKFIKKIMSIVAQESKRIKKELTDRKNPDKMPDITLDYYKCLRACCEKMGGEWITYKESRKIGNEMHEAWLAANPNLSRKERIIADFNRGSDMVSFNSLPKMHKPFPDKRGCHFNRPRLKKYKTDFSGEFCPCTRPCDDQAADGYMREQFKMMEKKYQR